MNSPSDYWEHRRQQMQQAQAPGADESHLPPHMRGSNQIAFPPGIAPAAPMEPAAPPVTPQLATLASQRPAMPLRPSPNLTDPRAIQAAFLRGELDTQR